MTIHQSPLSSLYLTTACNTFGILHGTTSLNKHRRIVFAVVNSTYMHLSPHSILHSSKITDLCAWFSILLLSFLHCLPLFTSLFSCFLLFSNHHTTESYYFPSVWSSKFQTNPLWFIDILDYFPACNQHQSYCILHLSIDSLSHLLSRQLIYCLGCFEG